MKEVLAFFLELMNIQMFVAGRKSSDFNQKLCKKA